MRSALLVLPYMLVYDFTYALLAAPALQVCSPLAAQTAA
jgi:hypothetical protein